MLYVLKMAKPLIMVTLQLMMLALKATDEDTLVVTLEIQQRIS